ncbi:MAG: hypothetical protein WAV25_01375 [Minisyncoccia bacterium]
MKKTCAKNNRFETILIEVKGHDAPHADCTSLGRFPAQQSARLKGQTTVYNRRNLLWINYPKKELGLDLKKICQWFADNFESGTYQGYYIILDHKTA